MNDDFVVAKGKYKKISYIIRKISCCKIEWYCAYVNKTNKNKVASQEITYEDKEWMGWDYMHGHDFNFKKLNTYLALMHNKEAIKIIKKDIKEVINEICN